jgi:uncharacterized membrane protein
VLFLKNSIRGLLFGLLCSLEVLLPTTPAEAINISLKNPYSQNLYATVVYFEDASGKWVTQGWYRVDPRSSRNLNFSSSTQRDFVYIHAYNSEASWGGSQDSIRRTVIRESFKYYDGEQCPPGNNRRQVQLDRWYTENDGAVYWQP